MSDIPVYMVVNLHVTDAETYWDMEKGFFPILKKSGGEFVTYDHNPMNIEVVASRSGRVIIFRFTSEQVAWDWYAAADYQAISEFRRVGTRMQLLNFVHGLPPKVAVEWSWEQS